MTASSLNARMSTARVVIIGAGTAGLAAAYTLKKHGIRSVVLEAASRAGGKLGGDRVDGFLLDEGADFLTGAHDVAFRLCNELEIPLVRSMMRLGWYKGGKYFTTSPKWTLGSAVSNLRALWGLGLLSPRAIRADMRIKKIIKDRPNFFSFASDTRIDEVDDEENAIDFLRRIGAPQDMRQAFQGFLEISMADLNEMGAAISLAYISQILMRADYLHVPEKGIGCLAHALADASGAEIRTSTPVRHVVMQNGDATAVVVDDGRIEADAVICTTTATTTQNMIPDLPKAVRNVLQKLEYASGCRMVIGLDHQPLPKGWNGVLYPEDETPLLLDRSVNLPACVPPGKSMLDLFVGRQRAEKLFALDDEEIKREMLRDVRRHPLPPGSNLPGDDEGIFFRVYRWPEALCVGPPGILEQIAKIRRREAVAKNLFLAGDYMRMPSSINGAFASGIDAAEQVVDLLKSSAE